MPESIDWARMHSPRRRRRLFFIVLAALGVIVVGGRSALTIEAEHDPIRARELGDLATSFSFAH